ncbi:hypothetical protein V6N13_061372 [Hibiscus sabdariffa]
MRLVKINVEGFFRSVDEVVALGVVARDSNGLVLVGGGLNVINLLVAHNVGLSLMGLHHREVRDILCHHNNIKVKFITSNANRGNTCTS